MPPLQAVVSICNLAIYHNFSFILCLGVCLRMVDFSINFKENNHEQLCYCLAELVNFANFLPIFLPQLVVQLPVNEAKAMNIFFNV